MKILFICWANVGRSQMAQALYNQEASSKSSSAGTKVEIENQKISDRPLAKPVIDFMKNEGIDISNNTTNQVTPQMLNEFDKIIVMAEPETIPSFLLNNHKTIIWDIEDPKGKICKELEKIVLEIKNKLKTLVK